MLLILADSVELKFQRAFDSPETARQAGDRLKKLGVKFGLIMAPCICTKVDESTFHEALNTFGRWAERAKLAGCDRAYNHIWPEVII